MLGQRCNQSRTEQQKLKNNCKVTKKKLNEFWLKFDPSPLKRALHNNQYTSEQKQTIIKQKLKHGVIEPQILHLVWGDMLFAVFFCTKYHFSPRQHHICLLYTSDAADE